ncbi:ribonuclease H-like protein, partial [Bimuria novae-zelandiae CBS 107.79]
TVKAMQDVLRTIGEATSGTKDVLQTRLLTRLPLNRIPHTVVNNNRERTRILSIDMGLKNLAYCVAEVQYSTPTLATTNMDIFSWRRIDLSEAYREYSLSGDQKSLENEALMEGRESEDLYTPESLSRMAYWFLNKVLSESHPNVILIERQRWRSAGSPTIQQWTVRVNTLEAAMWAILTTLRYEKALQVDWGMKAVDPKRVGHFWLDGVTPTPPPSGRKKTSVIDAEKDAEDDEEADKEGKRGAQKLSRSKAEKKAKIQLLRSWLNSDNPSTTLSTSNPGTEVFTPNISFTFSERHRVTNSTGYGAEGTRQALLYATDSPSERLERNAYNKAYVKKVDDITDCFLQAVAWVAWAVNRRSL